MLGCVGQEHFASGSKAFPVATWGASPIWPGEQVSQRPPRQIRQPPAPEVLRLVVQDVAALAERGQVHPWLFAVLCNSLNY